ncbi:MAG: hypothetical protein ACNA7O_18685 [Rhodobacterales bacterium]
MMRFSDDGSIYLLRKSQMNGKHAELFTFCLFESLSTEISQYGFATSYYEPTSTDEEPGLWLVRDFEGDVARFYLSIAKASDLYELYLAEPEEPKEELISILVGEGFLKKEGWWTKYLERSEMKHQALALACALSRET